MADDCTRAGYPTSNKFTTNFILVLADAKVKSRDKCSASFATAINRAISGLVTPLLIYGPSL